MTKPALQLGRLSAVAKIAIQPSAPADAEIALDLIDVRTQVRCTFRELESLADSIRESGVLQPILLHSEDNGRYRLIAGERRIRAAKLASLTTIPAVIKRGLTELEIRTFQVAENNDRDDLTAYDQAQGVIQDVEQHGTEAAAKIWNRTKGWISKRVATQRYAEPIIALLRDGLVADLEVLHGLNEIQKLAPDEVAIWTRQLDDGRVPARTDLRNRIAELKARRERYDAESVRPPTSATEQASTPETSPPAVLPPRSPLSIAPPAIPAVKTTPLSQPQPPSPNAEDEHWQAFLNAVGPALRELPTGTASSYLARLSELVQHVPLDQLLTPPKT